MQASACNFTNSNTPLWLFLTFFKLYKCYQIAQPTIYSHLLQINCFFLATMLPMLTVLIWKPFSDSGATQVALLTIFIPTLAIINKQIAEYSWQSHCSFADPILINFNELKFVNAFSSTVSTPDKYLKVQ